MHSDPKITERIRQAVQGSKLDERVMFGGAAFFLKGNFCCGVYHDLLVLRMGEEHAEEAIFRPHVVPMDITGKPMRGWVMVKPAGCRTARQLETWLGQAVTFVRTLPAKPATTKKPKKKK
jgi:TfoX/Sxy family transcriptional regulator of competence genes